MRGFVVVSRLASLALLYPWLSWSLALLYRYTRLMRGLVGLVGSLVDLFLRCSVGLVGFLVDLLL